MTSTWNFETVMSGPANCIVTVSGALVFSGGVEDVRSQHVEDSDPEKDDNCFGGTILQSANAAAQLRCCETMIDFTLVLLYASLCHLSVPGLKGTLVLPSMVQ